MGGDLNGTSLAVGRQKTFNLPAQMNPGGVIRIYPSWILSGNEQTDPKFFPTSAFYIAYRYPVVPFELFPNITSASNGSDFVTIHSYRGKQVRGWTEEPALQEHKLNHMHFTSVGRMQQAVYGQINEGMLLHMCS